MNPTDFPTKPKSESLIDKRAYEQSKYEHIYRDNPGKRFGRYGKSNHWGPSRDKIITLTQGHSFCDVGTGRGHFPAWCIENGATQAFGFDFAMQKAEIGDRWMIGRAAAHDIPLNTGDVDYVTAFDMLEHIIPEEVDEVLKEFRRVSTKGAIFSIAYKKSVGFLGSNLHPTVHNEIWWKERIESCMGPCGIEKEANALFVTYEQ